MKLKYSKMASLEGKTVIVTGACGLIGKEICRGISEYGGNVVVADINYSSAKVFAQELQNEYQVMSLAVGLDITSEESVNSMLDQVKKKYNSVYGLVNSAYPKNQAYGTIFEQIRFDDWKENINMHLNGYFNVTHKVALWMTENRKGSIINMGSIYGVLGPDFKLYEGTNMTNPCEYSAIKGGIVNLTRYLATYLAPYNIRVNSVSPGGVFDNQHEAFVKRYSDKTPLGRMARAEDITGGILYLLSDLSQYVTGHNLLIDGGWSAW